MISKNGHLFYMTAIFAFVNTVASSPISNVTDTSCTVNSYNELANAVAKCTQIVVKEITVPSGKAMDLNLLEHTRLIFEGRVTFEYAEWKGPFVKITGHNIHIIGTSAAIFNGQGELYWDGKGSSAKKPKMMIIEVTSAVIENIHLLNCPSQCVSLKNSKYAVLSGWTIDNQAGHPGVASAGKEAYNTDGFDVLSSSQVTIKDSTVNNQDDCIAVTRGSDMLFSNMHCNGSHGLSLSADYKADDQNYIRNVVFENSVIENSITAIHVKTIKSSAVGTVSNITYSNIQFSSIIDWAILVQQDYENGGFTGTPNNNIKITELNLNNVRGTVRNPKGSVPVYILCGSGSCSDWTWTNVEITNGDKKLDKCNFTPKGFTC